MTFSKSYFYSACIVYFFSSMLMFGAQEQNSSWSKKLTPRLFKSKNKEVLPTKEYTLAPQSTIDLTHIQGNVSVKTWEQNKIFIDAVKQGTNEEMSSTSIGVTHKGTNIAIATKVKDTQDTATIDFALMVPHDSTIKISIAQKGDIRIKQIRGSVQAQTDNGSIEIYDTVNTVIAKTNTGNIKVKQKAIVEPNTLFLETIQGNVHVYVPKKINASITAKTNNGMVSSVQPVTLNPQTLILNKDSWNNMRKDVKGILGAGGAPIIIDVSKGNIILDEY